MHGLRSGLLIAGRRSVLYAESEAKSAVGQMGRLGRTSGASEMATASHLPSPSLKDAITVSTSGVAASPSKVGVETDVASMLSVASPTASRLLISIAL